MLDLCSLLRERFAWCSTNRALCSYQMFSLFLLYAGRSYREASCPRAFLAPWASASTCNRLQININTSLLSFLFLMLCGFQNASFALCPLCPLSPLPAFVRYRCSRLHASHTCFFLLEFATGNSDWKAGAAGTFQFLGTDTLRQRLHFTFPAAWLRCSPLGHVRSIKRLIGPLATPLMNETCLR